MNGFEGLAASVGLMVGLSMSDRNMRRLLSGSCLVLRDTPYKPVKRSVD